MCKTRSTTATDLERTLSELTGSSDPDLEGLELLGIDEEISSGSSGSEEEPRKIKTVESAPTRQSRRKCKRTARTPVARAKPEKKAQGASSRPRAATMPKHPRKRSMKCLWNNQLGSLASAPARRVDVSSFTASASQQGCSATLGASAPNVRTPLTMWSLGGRRLHTNWPASRRPSRIRLWKQQWSRTGLCTQEVATANVQGARKSIASATKVASHAAMLANARVARTMVVSCTSAISVWLGGRRHREASRTQPWV